MKYRQSRCPIYRSGTLALNGLTLTWCTPTQQ